MKNEKKVEYHKLALAIDPTLRGFGYALFEGPRIPLDWGSTDIRSKQNENSLQRIKKLISYYHPEVLVLEDCSKDSSHRCDRIRILLDQIEKFAESQKIPVVKYSPDRIKEVFSFFDIHTKHQIAQKICEWLPDLNPRIPPKRKPWMSEDRRMGIFDAVALVLTYYYLEE
jgi:hypothetical protein